MSPTLNHENIVPNTGSVRSEGCGKTYPEGSSDEVASQETVMVGLHFEGLNKSRAYGQKLFIL